MAAMELTHKHRRRRFDHVRAALRRLPYWWWVTVVLLIAWWTLDATLSGNPWRLITVPAPGLFVAFVLLWWAPPERGTTHRKFFIYLLPRLVVPAVCLSALFQYNLSWNVRLIFNSIGILWLAGVVIHDRRKRREKAARALAELRKAEPPWNAFGIPLSDPVHPAVFTPMTGYEREMIARYTREKEGPR